MIYYEKNSNLFIKKTSHNYKNKFYSFQAFKLSKISVYEDRPTAKGIGFLGIALLGSLFAFIFILDCLPSKKKYDRNTDAKTPKI